VRRLCLGAIEAYQTYFGSCGKGEEQKTLTVGDVLLYSEKSACPANNPRSPSGYQCILAQPGKLLGGEHF
jgi:hypothetical protein